MPIIMHEHLRTQDRYRFLKGKITQITSEKVTVQPYDSNEHVDVFFDPQVTYFWKGGHNFTKTLLGAIGDEGTLGAFRDDDGRLLVETLFVNHTQVRGEIKQIMSNGLVVAQTNSTRLNDNVILKFGSEVLDLYDYRVALSQFKVGQNITAAGEILNPREVEIYKIHLLG